MNDNNYSEFINENWLKIKENIRNEYSITDICFNTWIKPLKFFKYNKGIVTILIPEDKAQACNYITNKYKDFFMVTISGMLSENYNSDMETDIIFVLENEAEKEELEDNTVYNINSENANLNPKYRFESFIIGNSNKFAHSAALAVADSPGIAYNPLYLYGGSGLGKTHLMHSIGHYILDQNPNMKILYVTSEKFTNDIVAAIRSGSATKMNDIRNKYRSVDVLMIDDIQYIIGRESTQLEFFNTFNELHSAGKQIVISSDKPPKEMVTLEERFRTRFEWGLTADIQAPDYETRMAILKEKADNCGINIEETVFDYIASNITSNVRELEGAYNKLIAYSRLHKIKEVDMSIVDEALKDFINKDNNNVITPELIMEVVSEHFNITSSDITSKRRTADLVLPRQICMYLCKEYTQDSLKDIANSLKRKDHTTVMYGIKKISEDIKVDKSLNNTINVIRKKLNPS